jgi:hypothetical protein
MAFIPLIAARSPRCVDPAVPAVAETALRCRSKPGETPSKPCRSASARPESAPQKRAPRRRIPLARVDRAGPEPAKSIAAPSRPAQGPTPCQFSPTSGSACRPQIDGRGALGGRRRV